MPRSKKPRVREAWSTAELEEMASLLTRLHRLVARGSEVPATRPGTAVAKNKKKRILTPWSVADLKQMKALAGKKSAPAIARELKRTASAVRQHASALGISLRVK